MKMTRFPAHGGHVYGAYISSRSTAASLNSLATMLLAHGVTISGRHKISQIFKCRSQISHFVQDTYENWPLRPRFPALSRVATSSATQHSPRCHVLCDDTDGCDSPSVLPFAPTCRFLVSNVRSQSTGHGGTYDPPRVRPRRPFPRGTTCALPPQCRLSHRRT